MVQSERDVPIHDCAFWANERPSRESFAEHPCNAKLPCAWHTPFCRHLPTTTQAPSVLLSLSFFPFPTRSLCFTLNPCQFATMDGVFLGRPIFDRSVNCLSSSSFWDQACWRDWLGRIQVTLPRPMSHGPTVFNPTISGVS